MLSKSAQLLINLGGNHAIGAHRGAGYQPGAPGLGFETWSTQASHCAAL
jgi:hypothetical protein